ncbi:MAG: hypothetical protein Q9202_007632 [Teloschistes flavicans]
MAATNIDDSYHKAEEELAPLPPTVNTGRRSSRRSAVRQSLGEFTMNETQQVSMKDFHEFKVTVAGDIDSISQDIDNLQVRSMLHADELIKINHRIDDLQANQNANHQMAMQKHDDVISILQSMNKSKEKGKEKAHDYRHNSTAAHDTSPASPPGGHVSMQPGPSSSMQQQQPKDQSELTVSQQIGSLASLTRQILEKMDENTSKPHLIKYDIDAPGPKRFGATYNEPTAANEERGRPDMRSSLYSDHRRRRSQSRASAPAPNFNASVNQDARRSYDDFRPSEIGYFQPNLAIDKEHPAGDYVTSNKDVYYRDVFLFTRQVARVANTKSVAPKLHLCLRGNALEWYGNLDDQMQDAIADDVNLFCTSLQDKYRISHTKALHQLQNSKYTMQDAYNQRSADEYVQHMIRSGRHYGHTVQAVLNWAWQNLEGELQRDIRPPDDRTNADDLIRSIDERAEYWATQRPRKGTYFPNNEATEAAFQRGVQSGERNMNRQQGGYMQGPTRNERNQVLPPPSAQTVLRSQPPPQPQGQHRFQNRYAAQAPANQRAYHASEDTPDEAGDQHAAEVYWNESAFPQGHMAPFSCSNCMGRFDDYHGLADHLMEAHGMDLSKQRRPLQQISIFSPVDKGYVAVPGKAYGGVTRQQNMPISQHICADTGTGGTFIDHHLASNILGLAAIRTMPIRVRGLAEGTVNKYVTFKVKFDGSDKVLDVTAYLYKGLSAGIILGNDTLAKYGIDVLLSKQVIIVDGVEIPYDYKKFSAGAAANHITLSPLRSCLKAKFNAVKSAVKSVKFAAQVHCKEFDSQSIIQSASQSGTSKSNCAKAANSVHTDTANHAASHATSHRTPATPSRADHLRSLPSWRLRQQQTSNIIGQYAAYKPAAAEKSMGKHKWHNVWNKAKVLHGRKS